MIDLMNKKKTALPSASPDEVFELLFDLLLLLWCWFEYCNMHVRKQSFFYKKLTVKRSPDLRRCLVLDVSRNLGRGQVDQVIDREVVGLMRRSKRCPQKNDLPT